MIRELIGKQHPESAPTPNAMRALAFSAHCAARLQPGEGDTTARRLSMDAWLRDGNITMTSLTVRASLKLQQGTAISQAEEGLPLVELRALGWRAAPGASCALIAPLGALSVSPPVDGIWSMDGALPLRQPNLGFASLVFFTELLTFGVVRSAQILVQVIQPGQISEDSAIIVRLFLACLRVFLLAIPLVVWHDHLPIICSGRIPLPLVVFFSPRANQTATFFTALVGGYLCFYATFLLLEVNVVGEDTHAGHSEKRELQLVISGVVIAILSAFFLYEAVLYTIFIHYQFVRFSRLGWRTQRIHIGEMEPWKPHASRGCQQPAKVVSQGRVLRSLGAARSSGRAQTGGDSAKHLELSDLSTVSSQERSDISAERQSRVLMTRAPNRSSFVDALAATRDLSGTPPSSGVDVGRPVIIGEGVAPVQPSRCVSDASSAGYVDGITAVRAVPANASSSKSAQIVRRSLLDRVVRPGPRRSLQK